MRFPRADYCEMQNREKNDAVEKQRFTQVHHGSPMERI